MANIKMGVTRKQGRPIFPKNKLFPPIDQHTCLCVSGSKKFVFWKTWRAWIYFKTRFEIRPFALLPTMFSTFGTISEVDKRRSS